MDTPMAKLAPRHRGEEVLQRYIQSEVIVFYRSVALTRHGKAVRRQIVTDIPSYMLGASDY